MVLGLFVGAALLMSGLVLLGHLSYANMDGLGLKKPVLDSDPESQAACPEPNDCILPMCFFRYSRVKNHETWVVAFLLSGCIVLLLSMV